MGSNIHLIIHDTAAGITGVILLATTIFLFVNNRRKIANITLALACLSSAIFIISHIIGVSVSDPILSRDVLMWNVSVIYVSVFSLHCILAVLKQDHQKRYLIFLIYAVGIGLTILYIARPDTFLLVSVPKMYFPDYYVPGNLHWVMRAIFNIVIPIYFAYKLLYAFLHETDQMERNRYLYIMLGMVLGWSVSAIPILLVYNIPVDPLFGIYGPALFVFPFTYAVINYDLLDIKIVAKKAAIYGLLIIGVGFAVTFLDFSNEFLMRMYPGFPFWLLPLILSAITVTMGVITWNKLREGDILKYEFITTATHKFRTPLTHIKWASENLEKPLSDAERKTAIEYIKIANTKLVELTDVLMNVSSSDDTSFEYLSEKVDLSEIVEELYREHAEQASIKKISFNRNIGRQISVNCDRSRVRFVMQTLIENALSYTHEGGTVNVSLISGDKNVVFSVKDSGIGIARHDLPRIFMKFYRGSQARSADTEGMGIGLYISKQIVRRHHGKIWVESEGTGQGSTFFFSLPAAKPLPTGK